MPLRDVIRGHALTAARTQIATFGGDYSLVSASQPYYFGRMTEMGGHVRKIRILRDKHKSVVLGMLPDDAIVLSIEAKISNRFGVREEIGEQRAEFEAKILAEQ